MPFGKYVENFRLIMGIIIKIWDLLITTNTNTEVWLQEHFYKAVLKSSSETVLGCDEVSHEF